MPKKNRSEESFKAKHRLRQKRRYQEIKNDPELLAKEQEKRRNKYKKRKEEGKLKPITKLTPITQREQREKWKENSKRYRLRKKGEKEEEPTFDAVAIIVADDSSVDGTEKQENSSALKEVELDELHKLNATPKTKKILITLNQNFQQKKKNKL